MTELYTEAVTTRVPENVNALSYALKQKKNVMSAVILRDMRTRFFNHGLGFLVVPIWPFCHMFVVMLIYKLMNRPTPFGDDLYIFVATAMVPTLSFMYISRFMSVSLLQNRPMLAFPAVKLLDIVLARAFLEVIALSITTLLIYGSLNLLGSDPTPIDPLGALLAFILIMVMATGVGIQISVLTLINPLFATLWAFVLILCYSLSGIAFVVSYLPADIAYLLSWNPVLHATEWIRVSFYPGYPDQILDKAYLAGCALLSIVCGLLYERLLRVRLLIT